VSSESIDTLIRSILTRQPDVYEQVTHQIGGRNARAAIAAMFTLAVERQFDEDASASDIAGFVSRIRSAYPNGHKVDPILAESLIRSALGDDSTLQGVDMADAPATEMFISTAVIDGLNLGEQQLNHFIEEASEFAVEGLDGRR
jgi:hypothetical protein